MDVYVGFGLLSAAVVVLLFIFFDSWFKSKRTRMAEMIASDDATSDDPEFNLDNDSNDLAHFEIHDNLAEDNIVIKEPEHPVSDSIEEVEHTAEIIDLYEDDSEEEMNLNSNPYHHETNLHESEDESDKVVRDANKSPNVAPVHDSLLILSVMAKPNCRFVSYDLLQAISTVGMQYGEMNIFHYYQQSITGKVTLFSLASANKPGDFDLDNMGDFSCSGLVFFMDIARVPDPQNVFRLMLETAERLADYLDGDLHADPRTPWHEKLVWQYQQKIMQYKTMARYDNTARL